MASKTSWFLETARTAPSLELYRSRTTAPPGTPPPDIIRSHYRLSIGSTKEPFRSRNLLYRHGHFVTKFCRRLAASDEATTTDQLLLTSFSNPYSPRGYRCPFAAGDAVSSSVIRALPPPFPPIFQPTTTVPIAVASTIVTIVVSTVDLDRLPPFSRRRWLPPSPDPSGVVATPAWFDSAIYWWTSSVQFLTWSGLVQTPDPTRNGLIRSIFVYFGNSKFLMLLSMHSRSHVVMTCLDTL